VISLPSRDLDDLSVQVPVLEVCPLAVGLCSFFLEGEDAVQAAHVELLVDVVLGEVLVAELVHDLAVELGHVLGADALGRRLAVVDGRRAWLRARSSTCQGMRLLTRLIIEVLAEVLPHHELQANFGSFLHQYVKNDQVFVNEFGLLGILLGHLLSNGLLQIEEVLEAVGTRALREAVLRQNDRHEVVRYRVVLSAFLSHAEDELVRVDSRSDEERAGFEALRHISQIVLQLVLALKHVMNSELCADNVENDLLSDIREGLLGLEDLVERSIWIGCIVDDEYGFEDLLSLTLIVVRRLALDVALDVAPLGLHHECLGEIHANVVCDSILGPFSEVTASATAKVEYGEAFASARETKLVYQL